MSTISELARAKQKNRIYMVLVIFGIATALMFAGLFFYNQRPSAIRNFENPYPLIDPARSFIAQEDFIVNIQPLRESLRAATSEFGDDSISIYVEYLNTGANISINPENNIWPASLAKVPLAIAAMKKIEEGEWTLSNELVLLERDRDERSGAEEGRLFEEPIGTRFTIEKLLEEMLINSDNTAFRILLRNIHNDDIEQIVEETGMEQLFTVDGKISAKEYSRMLRSLYVSSFLSRENSERILQWLDEAPFDDFLAHPIPADVPFAHKYGTKISLNTYADAGIVYLLERPYLITVLVQGDQKKPFAGERAQAAAFMQEISAITYEYFSSR